MTRRNRDWVVREFRIEIDRGEPASRGTWP